MKKGKLIPFVVKLTPEERDFYQAKANAHTDGNVSEWLRQAGMEFEPKEKKANGKNESARSRAKGTRH